jgi:hypothetical protein
LRTLEWERLRRLALLGCDARGKTVIWLEMENYHILERNAGEAVGWK